MQVEELLQKLYDEPDLEKRKYIPDKLAKLGDWRSTKPLGELIIDPNQPQEMKDEAVESLGKQGDPRAVKYLKQVLDHEDAGLRRTAVWSLGQIGTTETLEIIFTMTNDPNVEVRRWVAKSAGRVRNDDVISYLTDYFESISLYEDQRVLADIVRAVKDQIDRATASELKYWGKQAENILQEDLPNYIKQASMLLLNKCYERKFHPDEDLLSKIVESLPKNDPLLRPIAILGLGYAEAVDLLKELEDISALKALGIANETDYLNTLLEKQLDDEEIIAILEGFTYTNVLPKLDKYLNSDNLTIKLQAMELLARHKMNKDLLLEQFNSGKGKYKLIEIFRYYQEDAMDILEHSALEMDKVSRQNSVYSLTSEQMLQANTVHDRIVDTLNKVNEKDPIWHIRRDARIGIEKIEGLRR